MVSGSVIIMLISSASRTGVETANIANIRKKKECQKYRTSTPCCLTSFLCMLCRIHF